MSGPTLYDRLGVDPTASHEDLRRAFRFAAREVHPDFARDPSELTEREALTRALVEAWTILSDPFSRAEYDRQLGVRRGGLLRMARRRSQRVAGARRWRPGRPHPRIRLDGQSMIVRWPSEIASLAFDTRLGQWALVGAAITAGVSIGGPLLGLPAGLAAGLVVALALAGGGEPTPLYDAGAIFWPLSDGLGRGLGLGAVGLAKSLMSMLAERISEAQVSSEDFERLTEDDREKLRGEAGSWASWPGGDQGTMTPTRGYGGYRDPWRAPRNRPSRRWPY